MKKNVSLIGVMILLLFLFNTTRATEWYGDIWYVHPDSTLNSIQAGLDSCSAGDIVLVAAGTYYENLIWPDPSGIKLISESGLDSTIIDGGGIASVIHITTGVSSKTKISGFTIRNGHSTRGGGIYCFSASPSIVNNTITGNAAVHGAGIYCSSCSPIITFNTITANTADTSGGGVHCDINSSATITRNIVFGNTSINGAGIYCLESSPMITDNTITANIADYGGGGIGCDVSGSPTITGNIIFRNISNSDDGGGGGIGSGNGCSPIIEKNTFTENWADYVGGAIGLYDGTITNNTIIDNSADFGGGIVCSGSSSPTVTGNIIGDNHVNGSGGGIFLDVSNSASITDNIIYGNKGDHGGGIALLAFSSPTIRSNFITNNRADTSGAAIVCYTYSSPTIDSNTISGNSGPGITCGDNTSPQIHYNDITANTGYGVENVGSDTINAEYNWWGDPSGPGGVGPGTGDEVTTNVDYDPWLGSSDLDTVPPSSPYIFSKKSGNDNVLTWSKITSDTLGNQETMNYYVVYRDTSPSFIPGSSDSIGYVDHPDTTFTDAGVLDSTDNYYYIIEAVDWAQLFSKKSNMGYKLNKFLNENVVITDKNWTSLAWHNEYSTVSDLTDELSSSGDPLTKVTNLRNDQLYESWTFTTIPFPRWTGTNFAITSGRAYEMVTSKDTTLVLVGSNDPDGLVSLNENAVVTDKNWVSIPYNAVYNTVKDITDEYAPSGDPLTKITSLRDDQLYESWTYTTIPFPRWTGADFDIISGRGYEFVTINDTTWNPTEHSNEPVSAFLARREVPESNFQMHLGTLTEPDRSPLWMISNDNYLPATIKDENYYREPGISHLVRGYIKLKEFEHLVFTVYRPGRPYDALTENVVGCGTVMNEGFGLFWFDVGNFKKPWIDKEEVILIIEAAGNGKGYFTVVNVALDRSVDMQELAEISLVPIPEAVFRNGMLYWDEVDDGNIVGYSLYKDDKRLNETVLTRSGYSAAGDVIVRPVIRGGYETVYGSQGKILFVK